jgi:hypothetical protein
MGQKYQASRVKLCVIHPNEHVYEKRLVRPASGTIGLFSRWRVIEIACFLYRISRASKLKTREKTVKATNLFERM